MKNHLMNDDGDDEWRGNVCDWMRMNVLRLFCRIEGQYVRVQHGLYHRQKMKQVSNEKDDGWVWSDVKKIPMAWDVKY